jgi:hypothetical protein
MTDIDALVAEARNWQSRWDARRVTAGANVLIGGLLDALTAERSKVAALEAQLEAERALCAHSREPDVWRLNKEQSQQFAEAVLAATEEPHGKG